MSALDDYQAARLLLDLAMKANKDPKAIASAKAAYVASLEALRALPEAR